MAKNRLQMPITQINEARKKLDIEIKRECAVDLDCTFKNLTLDKIEKFLDLNNWEQIDTGDGYRSWAKNNCFGFDIDDTEIVVIGEEGDICNLPLNYYALVGYCIEKRQIAVDYKIPTKENN
jgi:hypothetical protein